MIVPKKLALLPILVVAQVTLAKKPWAARHHTAFVPSSAALFPSSLRTSDDASDAAIKLKPRLRPRPPMVAALHASKSAAATKKNKKKNAKSNEKGGGGFGASSPSSPTRKKQRSKSKDADVIAYPDLEPQVLQTLVPGASEEPSGVLAEEMYDRLEEIYGLEKFNFGGEGAIYKSIDIGDGEGDGKEVDDGSSSLFDDILSGGASSGSSSALDDLLSPAIPSTPLIPLGDVVAVESSTKSISSPASFDLNSIPPFQKFRVLHADPMVLAIDDFFTEEECDKYVQLSIDSENNPKPSGGEDLQPLLLGQSRTVGKDSRSKAQRTSTTWFHHYEGVPELMAKASRLLGLQGIDRWEEPQTVRYRRNEKFTWHLDALSPEDAGNVSGAGQRVATLLVYLTELSVEDGGATMFRDLGGGDGPLKVRPKKGSALLFFPAAGGIPNAPFDIRTLHCGEAVAENAANEKWIAQLWLREGGYKPTAPAGNEHANASDAIGKYCNDCLSTKD